MKLWLLRPVDGLPEGATVDEEQNPWHPWYDKAFGFVVRAATEDEARALAQADGGDEVEKWSANRPAWTDPRYSTCVELTVDGEPGIVIQDFHAA